jgi:hypothetical protein
LKKISFLLKVVVEGFTALLDILQELVDDAAEAPNVRCLIVLFLDQGNLWGSIPSRAYMD